MKVQTLHPGIRVSFQIFTLYILVCILLLDRGNADPHPTPQQAPFVFYTFTGIIVCLSNMAAV